VDRTSAIGKTNKSLTPSLLSRRRCRNTTFTLSTQSEHFFSAEYPGGRNKTNFDVLGGKAVIDQILVSSFVIALRPGTALAAKKFARPKP
jgi:hypothetical protein